MSIDNVADISPRVQYVASAAQEDFDYPFPIFDDTDLVVDVDGVTQTLTTHYTVTGEGEDTGGTVTFVTPMAGNEVVTIYRDMAIERLTDFQQNGPYSSASLNDDLDRITLVLQDLKSGQERSLRFSPTSEATAAQTQFNPISNWTEKFVYINASGIPEPATGVTGSVLSQATIGATLYPQTAAEASAGVTPSNFAYAPGYRARYSTLADQIAVSATHPAFLSDNETIAAAVTVPSGAQIYGIGRPLITQSTAGARIFNGDSCTNIVLDGVRFKGADSSTVPSSAFGGWAAIDTGLVTFTDGSDIRVTDCEFDTFYNGLSLINCSRVWVERNRVTHWLVYGVLLSNSDAFTVERNVIVGCDQAGAENAYGVMATGDDAGGDILLRNSISFNVIGDIPSWDGIMSHDCSGLRIVGNDIRNVRIGLDIGPSGATNEIRDIQVAGNYIESTATNTWGATPANHGGILVAGWDSGNPADRVVITSNIVRNFFTTAGMVGSGDFSNIVVSQCSRTVVSGNVVQGAGSVMSNAGIYAVGANDGLAISGNSLQGSMGAGGIRFAGVTADAVSVCGNTIKQVTASDTAINVTASTLSAFAMEGNATNSTGPFAQATSTITWSDSHLRGSATFDPSNLVDGAGETTTVTVTGAALGDFAEASFSLDLQGITLTAWVSSANTVSVRFQNESGGTLDLASGTLRAKVRRG